jgi:3'-phosphoadenosine 5'-phosphosulfate sulfotransferase (PAPS reductase)/FAD synthetase
MTGTVFFPKVSEKVHISWNEKLAQTLGVIDEQLLKYPPKRQMIAWSGGKDSTAVLYLVRKECDDFGLDFHDITVSGPPLKQYRTGRIEYPETTQFVNFVVKELGLNYHEEISPLDYWDLIRQKGLPRKRGDRSPVYQGKLNSNCCQALKILPMLSEMRKLKTSVVYLGTTAPESHQRQMKAIQLGQTYIVKKWDVVQCLPILYWTEDEVWRYTYAEDIPYNSIYDRGAMRCGCATCTAYTGWETDMLKLAPKCYDKVQEIRRGK